jgi:hypothetical protein
MLFLDHQSRFFRSFIGRIRAFLCRSTWRRSRPPSADLRCVTRSGTDSSGRMPWLRMAWLWSWCFVALSLPLNAGRQPHVSSRRFRHGPTGSAQQRSQRVVDPSACAATSVSRMESRPAAASGVPHSPGKPSTSVTRERCDSRSSELSPRILRRRQRRSAELYRAAGNAAARGFRGPRARSDRDLPPLTCGVTSAALR